MTSKTDKIRAALVLAIEYAPNEYWKNQYRQLVSELDGCVIVPVEPTDEMLNAGLHGREFGTVADVWESMIAPYVNGEKK